MLSPHPTASARRAPADDHQPTLAPGAINLIGDLKTRLEARETINNPKLTELAAYHLGGSRAQGVYSSRDAYDLMEAAVNLHLSEDHAARLQSANFAEAISELRELTARLPRQTDRTHEQTELQQFSTPPPLAYLAAKILNARSSDVVLEPSAGTGGLAVWPRAAGAQVLTNEMSERRSALLTYLGFAAYRVDAEILDDLLPAEVRPTAVLMNPPFSATGGRVAQHKTIYGARHVESALKRLRQGGRLVAIVGEGMSLERPAFSAWWQRIAAEYDVRANIHLNGREYGKYGTTFDNQILVIDKTGPTPGDTWEMKLESIRWMSAGAQASVEEAWEILGAVSDERVRDDSGVESNHDEATGGREESHESALFVSYVPAKIEGGREHPAMIVESASMAAIEAPDVTYRPHLDPKIITEGNLSVVQFERIIYAGQRHEQRLPDGARGGFFVGDGTGVGKGRILAGIILDNWNQGRRRALWLSVNNDLLESARRDLDDLGGRIPLARVNDYQAGGEITLPEGVIFSSYSSLIATAKSGERRLDQIQSWLGPDGVVILDESHKAKNAVQGGRGEATQTGQAVIDLQDPEVNPDYRVVYSSATGATDVRNMAYMTRLGLWGDGAAFPGGFMEFLTEIEAGGVGAMEMVSRDMKALGMYASGSISFGTDPGSGKAVEYREVIHQLTPGQREMYDAAARAWQAVLKNIDAALAETNGGTRARAVALNKFWGDHQRFFRQVITAFKVPAAIAETERSLAEGKSVILSLVGTGEARTREQVARATAEGGLLEDLDFSPREVIAEMVDRGFPTTLYQDKTDAATGKTIKIPVKDSEGNVVESREAVAMKRRLIDSLSGLVLPENPLDQLVNHFGEGNVAELTGRMRRLIRDKRTGRVEYRKRAPEGVAMERTNVHEMGEFQKGRKRVAIISDAASTGISLHASNRAENRQRRVHITLELGWSADKQMQTFGRSHRSDQVVPPEYVLLSTELGGEKRFSSTIARRLGSLGALTKGDRGAADAGDLAKYNFETHEGRAALSLFFRRILEGASVPGIDEPRQALRDMGLLVERREGGEGISKEDEYHVPRFLNRVLALDVGRQNALFDYYAELFDQTVRYAKQNGTFDEGVADVRALSVRKACAPRVVHQDAITGAHTTHYRLEIDRPTDAVSLEEALKVRERKGGTFLRHKRTGNYVFAAESSRHTDPETGRSFQTYALYRPQEPRYRYIHECELEKYHIVTPEAAREWWEDAHRRMPAVETSEINIIGGAIIPLWQHLKTHRDAQLKVARVSTDEGQRIVGIIIPPGKVARVLKSLGVMRKLKDTAQIINAVLEEGEEVKLAANLVLKAGKLQGEPVVEVCRVTPYQFATLREIGLINEQINWQQRFFIPSDETKGPEALNRLLVKFPVSETTEDGEEGEPEGARETAGFAAEVRKVNVLELCHAVEGPAEEGGETATPDAGRCGEAVRGEAEETPAESVPGGNGRMVNMQPLQLPLPTRADAPATRKTEAATGRSAPPAQLGFVWGDDESPRSLLAA